MSPPPKASQTRNESFRPQRFSETKNLPLTLISQLDVASLPPFPFIHRLSGLLMAKVLGTGLFLCFLFCPGTHPRSFCPYVDVVPRYNEVSAKTHCETGDFRRMCCPNEPTVKTQPSAVTNLQQHDLISVLSPISHHADSSPHTFCCWDGNRTSITVVSLSTYSDRSITFNCQS